MRNAADCFHLISIFNGEFLQYFYKKWIEYFLWKSTCRDASTFISRVFYQTILVIRMCSVELFMISFWYSLTYNILQNHMKTIKNRYKIWTTTSDNCIHISISEVIQIKLTKCLKKHIDIDVKVNYNFRSSLNNSSSFPSNQRIKVETIKEQHLFRQ